MQTIKIAPSILSADLLKLQEQVRAVEENGADYIHVDIMDGHFVPNITFGPVIVSTLRKITDLPLDVHLMIMNADQYLTEFIKAGADIVTVHQEANSHLHRTIMYIKEQGIKAGVSINPATDLSAIKLVLDELDLVLLMTVNPGFGGQSFISSMLTKIKKLADLKANSEARFMIEVDGGIHRETIPPVVQAGAEILVAGNAIFSADNPGEACRQLKEIAGKTLENL